ncbi:alpha/beta fold hydrolase [uncultured Shimia sp.]|uniref:alpha/beta hydrolase n=2 Tax=Shimia TaxID=573139 RepID=UPI0026308F6A|nr:alpha/beta fold hydrolase [uncultured Shimia sp.]
MSPHNESSMRLFAFILSALALSLTSAAHADPIEIPGPAGPLGGEYLAVDGARHLVITIPGSGPIDRDGNGPAIMLHSDSYRLIAEGLAEHGIASIRIDKRGFFRSEAAVADPNDVTIAGYGTDMRGWIARAHEEADCVWLAGHSEGGLVALEAASHHPDGLCGLILMAAPGRPIGGLLIEQLAANPMNAPLMADLRAIVADLEAGKTRPLEDIPPALHMMFQPGVQRFMIDLFSYAPAELARAWPGPALILQGDRDLQVKPLDAALLAEALPNATRHDLAGATHMLKSDKPGAPFATYSDPTLPLHPDLIPTLAEFLSAHAP